MSPLRRVFLRDGALTIGIAPECGGSVTHFDFWLHDTIVHILRPAVEPRAGSKCALGASSFVLVPYGGRLREGQFTFDGRNYRLPLNALPERHTSHGDGWTRPWVLTHLDRRTAVMALEPDASAPLPYHCTQTVSIRADRVQIELSVRNAGIHRMPVGLGLHPYFANRSLATVKANMPVRWLWDHEMMPLSTERNPFTASLLRGRNVSRLPIAAEYADWDGRAMIDWPTQRVRVQLTTDPPLKHVVMWIPGGESFFCFEPISHATDALNDYPAHPSGEDFVFLQPGASCNQLFDFCVSAY